MTQPATQSSTRDRTDAQRRDVASALSAPRYGRLLGWLLVLAVAVNFLWIIATNPNFEWNVVYQCLWRGRC